MRKDVQHGPDRKAYPFLFFGNVCVGGLKIHDSIAKCSVLLSIVCKAVEILPDGCGNLGWHPQFDAPHAELAA